MTRVPIIDLIDKFIFLKGVKIGKRQGMRAPEKSLGRGGRGPSRLLTVVLIVAAYMGHINIPNCALYTGGNYYDAKFKNKFLSYQYNFEFYKLFGPCPPIKLLPPPSPGGSCPTLW